MSTACELGRWNTRLEAAASARRPWGVVAASGCPRPAAGSISSEPIGLPSSPRLGRLALLAGARSPRLICDGWLRANDSMWFSRCQVSLLLRHIEKWIRTILADQSIYRADFRGTRPPPRVGQRGPRRPEERAMGCSTRSAVLAVRSPAPDRTRGAVVCPFGRQLPDAHGAGARHPSGRFRARARLLP